MYCLILDFDGTIVNPWKRLYAMHKDLCKHLKVKPLSKKKFVRLKRKGLQEVDYLEFKQNGAGKQYAKQKHKILEAKKYLQYDSLYPGALDFIKENSKISDIFIISSRKNRSNFSWELNKFGIKKYFKGYELKGKNAQTVKKYLRDYENIYLITDTEEGLSLNASPKITSIAFTMGLREEKILKKAKPNFIVSDFQNLKDKYFNEEILKKKSLKNISGIEGANVFLDFKNEPSLYDLFKVLSYTPKSVLLNGKGMVDHYGVLASEFAIPLITVRKKFYRQDFLHSREIKNDLNKQNTTMGDFITKVKVKINLGSYQIIKKNPDLVKISDGVGFLRTEFILLSILEGLHPNLYIKKNGKKRLLNKFTVELEKIIKPFAKINKPVWLRTNDFATDELMLFKGGARFETKETNPALGFRGIRRSFDENFLLEIETETIKKLTGLGFKNIGVFPPMVRLAEEYFQFKRHYQKLNLKHLKIGLMIETPSIALTFEDVAKHVDFAIFGSNDLTQFTLAVDRQNPKLKNLYDEKNKAVLSLFKRVIKLCNKYNVESSIGGKAANNWELVEKLLEFGIKGISTSPNADIIFSQRQNVYNWEKNNG